jgi:hypothetical protein
MNGDGINILLALAAVIGPLALAYLLFLKVLAPPRTSKPQDRKK